MDISRRDTQCEQIRVCYETALECRDFNPEKRPASAQKIIDRLHQMEIIQVCSKLEILHISLFNSELLQIAFELLEYAFCCFARTLLFIHE
jgi:hypothetical protein